MLCRSPDIPADLPSADSPHQVAGVVHGSAKLTAAKAVLLSECGRAFAGLPSSMVPKQNAICNTNKHFVLGLHPEATGQYLVEYDAYATLDLEGMDWHASVYRLCDDHNVRIEELTIGKQHIKPLALPEHRVWPIRRGGGGGGGGRGPGGGRGRRRALRDGGDDVDMDAGDARPIGEGPDASGSDGGGGSGRADSASSGRTPVDAPGDSDSGSDSDESVFAQLLGRRLEARGRQQCEERSNSHELLTKRYTCVNVFGWWLAAPLRLGVCGASKASGVGQW